MSSAEDIRQLARHQTVLDVEGEQVGERYARAFLRAAQHADGVDQLVEELEQFVAQVLMKHPKIFEVLSSPLISSQERIQLLEKALRGQVSQLVLNFLRVVIDHERMRHLVEIVDAVRRLLDEQRGRVRVWVRTATELTDQQQEQLRQALRQRLGKEPVLSIHVDPSLIGGLVVQVGDTVYDASVTAQLSRLRSQIVDRCIHEIQSR